jgi:large subunit ribosomal protein L2
MPTKNYQPTSPGRRFQSVIVSRDLNKTGPEESLMRSYKRSGGRNNTGRITARHRGGGAKRRYRVIDFARRKRSVPGVVHTIEYDPNRNAFIALIHYVDGEKCYILYPVGLNIGATVLADPAAPITPGNAVPLKNIPLGTSIHNIALKIDGRGQMCRSAGSQAQLVAKDGVHAQIKLPSGEVRKVHHDCWASIGQVGNTDYENISFGKAGRTRHRGRRPHVRGMAMNPVDHPHGGGEGRSKGTFAQEGSIRGSASAQ